MNAAIDFAERDALLQKAIGFRSANRLPEALTTLNLLKSLHPRFSRLYQELGHCHVLQRNAPAAIEALREAVRLNPTLPASWDMLAQLYRLVGDTAQAAAAANNLATLKQLPPEVVVANSLFADGDFDPAEDVIRDYLSKDNSNAGALRLLARLCQARGASGEAERLLQAVLAQAPDYHAARSDYTALLLEQQKHAAARKETDYLLQCEPQNRAYLKQAGMASIGLGDYDKVIEISGKLLAGMPQSGPETADLQLWRANALKVTGRQEEAVAAYRAALAARPDYGVAWFGLANLKTYRFSDTDISCLRAAEAQQAIADMDRVYLCFALGKALEDRCDYEASWQYYKRGNAVRRATSRWRPEICEAAAARIKQVFTAEFFAARQGWGAQDPAPVFVVGLPRSGSTLIEQILASHSSIEGTQELTEIGRYASEICGQDSHCGLPENPEALSRLTAQDAHALGERFLAETAAYRRSGKPFFIDKMPNNFWHIGFIHLILPQAAIIDVRREPMACGFSNLKQLFGTANQEFSYDARHLARYYRSYLDLMHHWNAVLPGRVLTLHYEDVVENLEGSVQRLLAHCGLLFEAACVDFHKTARSVRTPSSEQVRQPISRNGLEQWRNYEPWLAPMREALGDALATYEA